MQREHDAVASCLLQNEWSVFSKGAPPAGRN